VLPPLSSFTVYYGTLGKLVGGEAEFLAALYMRKYDSEGWEVLLENPQTFTNMNKQKTLKSDYLGLLLLNWLLHFTL
jgi:hypothetical protein